MQPQVRTAHSEIVLGGKVPQPTVTVADSQRFDLREIAVHDLDNHAANYPGIGATPEAAAGRKNGDGRRHHDDRKQPRPQR